MKLSAAAGARSLIDVIVTIFNFIRNISIWVPFIVALLRLIRRGMVAPYTNLHLNHEFTLK